MSSRQAVAEGMTAMLPRLRRFAIGLSGSREEGDDLVQAACLRALERYQQWQPGSRLDSWMFRIVHTIWLDRRKAARNREISVDADQLAASAGGATDGVDAKIHLARVRLAISRLPQEQKEVLLLVTVEGFSYAEAAAMLQIPTGTVMSRLARARLALAKQFEPVAN